MKNCLLMLSVIALLGSCDQSKKGKWIEKDKKEFLDACTKSIAENKDLKEMTKMSLDLDADKQKKICERGMGKLEAEYALKDVPQGKAEEVGAECGVKELIGEKGKWHEDFRKAMHNTMMKSVAGTGMPENIASEMVDCIIANMEKNIDPKDFENIDDNMDPTLLGDCQTKATEAMTKELLK